MSKLGAFIFGAALGVTAGLLLAPKSGEETREEALNLAKDFWGQAQSIKDRVSNSTLIEGIAGTNRDADSQEKIDAARKIIAEQVTKNANAAHEALSKNVPIAAEKITNVAAVAHNVADNLADKIYPNPEDRTAFTSVEDPQTKTTEDTITGIGDTSAYASDFVSSDAQSGTPSTV